MAFKNVKCNKKSFCMAMTKNLRAPNDVGRGMATVVVMNLKTGKERTVGVGYRVGMHAKPTMFNFCPWCGEKILWAKDG